MKDPERLSPARKHLLDLMQRIGFGRIEGLVVRENEPVFDPCPTVKKLLVFGKEEGRLCSQPGQTCKAKRMAELFDVFDQEGALVIDELIIDNGIPVRMTHRERVAP